MGRLGCQSHAQANTQVTRNPIVDRAIPSHSLVVLAGPSGSGKSTWAAEHFQPDEIVASDRLRAMVGAGEADQTAGTTAFELLEKIVAARLSRRLTTVIDTLGTDQQRRSAWIDAAHDADMTAVVVVFDTPLDVCLERNRARPFPTPQAVVRRQHSELASQNEDFEREFDRVIHVGVTDPETPSEKRPSEARSTAVSGKHRFGLLISRFDWVDGPLGPALADVARRAEAAGFTDVWLMDHFRQIPQVGRAWEDIPEPYVTLGYMAAATKSLRLGVLVSGVTHRHPVVLGQMVAALDVLSDGRAVCGLGAAWDEDEHRKLGIPFPGVSARYDLLEDALRLLPLLWGPGTPSFEGKVISAEALTCYPRPIQDPIPIMVGGSGERRTLRLVAELADACNVFGDPVRVAHKASVLRGHCEDVDRDPADVAVSHLLSAMTAPSRSELMARADRVRDRNTPAETFLARAGGLVDDELIEQVGRYRTAGADHTIFTLADIGLDDAVESFTPVIAAHRGG